MCQTTPEKIYTCLINRSSNSYFNTVITGYNFARLAKSVCTVYHIYGAIHFKGEQIYDTCMTLAISQILVVKKIKMKYKAKLFFCMF